VHGQATRRLIFAFFTITGVGEGLLTTLFVPFAARVLHGDEFTLAHCSAPRQYARRRGAPPRADLINVGRGQLVDKPVLARASAEGWIACAGLDVFEQEPLPEGPRLLKINVQVSIE